MQAGPSGGPAAGVEVEPVLGSSVALPRLTVRHPVGPETAEKAKKAFNIEIHPDNILSSKRARKNTVPFQHPDGASEQGTPPPPKPESGKWPTLTSPKTKPDPRIRDHTGNR